MKKNLVLNYKVIGVLVAAVLLLSCAIGGTMAWLATKSDEVKNTFTTSDINITLAETKTDFKMVPGYTIEKDPKVTVKANSEACYLFVEIKESTDFNKYLAYKVDETKWTRLDEETSRVVYFQRVNASTGDQVFFILGAGTYSDAVNGDFSWTADHVFVLPTVKKEDMETAKTNQPTLTFTAYAVQLYKKSGVEFTAVEAWNQAKALASTSSTSTTPTT